MKKLVGTLVSLAVTAVLLSSCKGHESPGPQPFGILNVNGPSVNGGVEVGGVRIFTLAGITASSTYLVRTQIAEGGNLQASIYSSFSAYRQGQPPVTTTVSGVPNLLYEFNFTSTVAGDYVIVLTGTPASPTFSTLSFFNLRLMCADTNANAVGLFQAPTVTSSVEPAFTTGTVYPDSFVVYSSTSISSSGTFSILLTSSTLTISYPQMFIYDDKSLRLENLLYSVISSSETFTVSIFSTHTPTTVPTSSFPSATLSVPSVTFPTGTNGPYILLRGVSQATYTLTVTP